MAAIEGKIIMSTCEGRPCWVRGRRAIFHRWTDSARPVKPVSYDQDTDDRMQKWSVHGLVEYEDGRMEREWPSAIRFADSAEYFDSLAWDQMEARRDATDSGEHTPEMRKTCYTCAHGAENKEYCAAAEYKCEDCAVIDCRCRFCTDDKPNWEPKEAAHG